MRKISLNLNREAVKKHLFQNQFMNNKLIKKKKVNLNPPSLLALSFLVAMLIGTVLLKMPFSHHGEISWIKAGFTSMSAITITGLSVVNIGEEFTRTGQLIVLGLIQLGGVGFMTFSIIAVLSFSKKMGLKQQLMAQESLDQTDLSKVGFVAKSVLIYSLFFEFIGFVLLTINWREKFGWIDSAFYGFFYSVSAFNNAGFSLFNNIYIGQTFSSTLFMIISVLYVIGGIGFIVLMDIRKHKTWRKLRPNSKIILSGMLFLNLFSFILIWILEAHNPYTIQHMAWSEQAVHAWFQATATRSSGFNSLDIHHMTQASTFLMMMLMFIGGGSLSTAGGIKIGTFIILLLSTIAFLSRQDEVMIFKYSIARNTVIKALAVFLITSFFVAGGLFFLLITEPSIPFLDLLFEVVSAVCTVGLSRGVTGNLSDLGLCVVMLLMYMGRLGPLMLAYLIATPKPSRLKHPEAEIQIG